MVAADYYVSIRCWCDTVCTKGLIGTVTEKCIAIFFFIFYSTYWYDQPVPERDYCFKLLIHLLFMNLIWNACICNRAYLYFSTTLYIYMFYEENENETKWDKYIKSF